MKIKSMVQAITILTIALLLGWASPAPMVVAANQSNQDLNQPALLFSADSNHEISIYPKPDLHPHRIGYGMSGDRVTILEQTGSNEGKTWSYIRLDKPPYQKGWVREDNISVQVDTHQEFTRSQGSPSLPQRDYRSDRFDSGDQQSSNQYQQQKQQYHYQ
ncbi:SH3 domain-containing protein [Egbenema bharatensis]|uniref:SH3 domain-containing protein n=1 Tax=Egbenema bharatensis TaxID=3463334 RepID=UPI003A886EAC